MPLRTYFIVFHKFGNNVYQFSFNSLTSLIFFLISVLTCFSTCNELYSFHEFVTIYYLYIIQLSIFSINPWWSARIQGVTSIFFYLLRLSFYLNMWPPLVNSHELLRRRYSLLYLGEMFCKYLLCCYMFYLFFLPCFTV